MERPRRAWIPLINKVHITLGIQEKIKVKDESLTIAKKTLGKITRKQSCPPPYLRKKEL
jgi:hypothetical protein